MIGALEIQKLVKLVGPNVVLEVIAIRLEAIATSSKQLLVASGYYR